MADAFKCDRCGAFSEGEPRRIKVREYLSQGITGWTKGETAFKGELCNDCAEAYEWTIEEFLEGDTDE